MMGSRFSRAREWILRFVLLATSLIVAVLMAEIVVRFVHPINDGRANVTLAGVPIKDWFEPGLVYRQVANEYNAVTTITPLGHRVPGTDGNPEVVFLGDSFTYGWGLHDEETFAAIYCQQMGAKCANLGRPGTGTAKQLDRLQQFIDRHGWRPREVKLFFFGMSSAWSAGNDFVDNYDERELSDARAGGQEVIPLNDPSPPPASRRSMAERLIGYQSFILQRSNLMRIVKYYWGPVMKSLLVAEPGAERIAIALRYTKQNLRRLDEMSKKFGFDYNIYLIVPVQDVILGTYKRTLQDLTEVAPKSVVGTAQLFLDRPAQYYYAYDGHINAKGSRRIGEFLIDHDRSKGAVQ